MIVSVWHERHCLDASPSAGSFVRVVLLGRTVTICTLGTLSAAAPRCESILRIECLGRWLWQLVASCKNVMAALSHNYFAYVTY